MTDMRALRFLIRVLGWQKKKILGEFGLDALASSQTWISLRKPDEQGSATIAARIRYAIETFPQFINILLRDSEEKEIILETLHQKIHKGLSTKKMTFFIREPNTPTLTLKELSSIILDIEAIFQAILKIEGREITSDLIVVALDSGSEKSIDVVGLASAVEKLSTFLLEAWDRIRFARASKLRASIKTASDGLIVLTDLKAAQDKGVLTPEEAEKLKRTVLKNVDELCQKGVYTKEMQESIPTQPNQIEFQRTKLITHYGDPASTNNLNEHEVGQRTEISEDESGEGAQ